MRHTTYRVKSIVSISRAPNPHWVGDGFPVRTIISPRAGQALGPFILMDYAGPYEFAPSEVERGVDTHPHKGFETVTIVFQGEVVHRDSKGNGGKIGPGDVQWMTAGSGVLHEEKHSKEFTKTGGVLEMAQIWVNLPAQDKKVPAKYQTLMANDIPRIPLEHNMGWVRVIAGAYNETPGAAKTYTPVTIWQVTIHSSGEIILPVLEGQLGGVYVRDGQAWVGNQEVNKSDFAEFTGSGTGIAVKATASADLLVLAGEPINEPMVAYGPFVMNSMKEIQEAMAEFQAGMYGSIES